MGQSGGTRLPNPDQPLGLADPNLAAGRETDHGAPAEGGGAGRTHAPVLDAAAAAERLLESWPTAAVAVALGRRGAVLVRGGQAPLAVPAAELSVKDACGAGDQFAVALALALARGAVVSEAVTAAVDSATGFLAAGGVDSLSVSAPGQGIPAGHPPSLDRAATRRPVQAEAARGDRA